MSYTKEERREIGRRIYHGEISKSQAMEEYNISYYTARDYMRIYRDLEHLPPKPPRQAICVYQPASASVSTNEEYQDMSKEELIRALAEAKINIARLKKGYTVRGAGAEKEYILLDSANTK